MTARNRGDLPVDWTEADLPQNREIIAMKNQIADIHIAVKRDNLMRRVEALEAALADIHAAFKRDHLVHRVEALESAAKQ